jgi:hypothetical protein
MTETLATELDKLQHGYGTPHRSRRDVLVLFATHASLAPARTEAVDVLRRSSQDNDIGLRALAKTLAADPDGDSLAVRPGRGPAMSLTLQNPSRTADWSSAVKQLRAFAGTHVGNAAGTTAAEEGS